MERKGIRTGLAAEVPALLQWATEYLRRHGVSKPRLNAEQILSHCTGRSRVELYAFPENPVPAGMRRSFIQAVRRRSRHEPLQYIVGCKGFRYLELAVDRRVLIPRPETEMLVERALTLLQKMGGHPLVVDVGTGSGCIALSLAKEFPAAVVHATDISRDALEAARENAARSGLEGLVEFHSGDCLDALPRSLRGKFNLVVSNPPYIREDDFVLLPPEVREHEPRQALVAGPLGVEMHLRLLEEAPAWLAPGGWLLMEGSEDQVGWLARLALEMGYASVEVHPDLNGRPRMVQAGRRG